METPCVRTIIMWWMRRCPAVDLKTNREDYKSDRGTGPRRDIIFTNWRVIRWHILFEGCRPGRAPRRQECRNLQPIVRVTGSRRHHRRRRKSPSNKRNGVDRQHTDVCWSGIGQNKRTYRGTQPGDRFWPKCSYIFCRQKEICKSNFFAYPTLNHKLPHPPG